MQILIVSEYGNFRSWSARSISFVDYGNRVNAKYFFGWPSVTGAGQLTVWQIKRGLPHPDQCPLFDQEEIVYPYHMCILDAILAQHNKSSLSGGFIRVLWALNFIPYQQICWYDKGYYKERETWFLWDERGGSSSGYSSSSVTYPARLPSSYFW
jgi:hypothetical protein